MEFDYLIVGAGITGMVLAERLCTQQNKKVLLIDNREHIGGNCYDHRDNKTRITLHKYGPHYFRTNSDDVVKYLSQFTEWKRDSNTKCKISVFSDGKMWPFPINLNTFELFLGRESSEKEFTDYLNENRFLIETPRNLEESFIGQMGTELYEKLCKNYLIKKWGTNPIELPPGLEPNDAVVKINRDDYYFTESFQANPLCGYSRMFEEMTKRCGENLAVLLHTNYFDMRGKIPTKHTIYTGPVDKFYNYQFGVLPYRSFSYKEESYNTKHYQSHVQVNYPNSEDFTNIVEIKHFTTGIKTKTIIVKEYSKNYSPDNDPYYPMADEEAKLTYAKYKELADHEKDVTFIGRLATYQHYNMDRAVELALQESERLKIINP